MRNRYESPFVKRYASDEMSFLFSDNMKFRTWRKLWIALAEAEKELGLDIKDEQIEELKKYEDDVNYDVAAKREKEVRHDVMAHIYAYGEQAKSAKGIIHLGATSCYVTDNTDIIVIRKALEIVAIKLASVINSLKDFALEYKDLPTLGFTHFQPAQITTVGKRATLWIQDLLMDLEQVERLIDDLVLLGSKGTTGTQASFMELFDNDNEKVRKLDELIAEKLDFKGVFPVSGQTYTRKLDSLVLNVLSSICQSAHKFANDIRLLQSLKEIEEPFGKKQIGSSAMAYKRNPMRTERITGISRFVIVNAVNAHMTASEQWLERTLDDSSNKRLAVSECFLGTDSVLDIYLNVTNGLVVYPKMIEKHIMEELPFMATENILMEAVKEGGDRQELHERIRVHSMDAGETVKVHGKENDLIERIVEDSHFNLSKDEINSILDPYKYVGRAPQQTVEFIDEYVNPKLKEYEKDLIVDSELTV